MAREFIDGTLTPRCARRRVLHASWYHERLPGALDCGELLSVDSKRRIFVAQLELLAAAVAGANASLVLANDFHSSAARGAPAPRLSSMFVGWCPRRARGRAPNRRRRSRRRWPF